MFLLHTALGSQFFMRSYSLTFMLLAAEMASFCIFVAPLPSKVRRKLFRFLSESPIIAKVAYGLKISFMYASRFHLHINSEIRCA
jgi:hypothetical protein